MRSTSLPQTVAERSPDSSPARRWIHRLLRAAMTLAAVGVLLWLLERIGWDKVGAAFARMGLGGAAILIALGILENTFDATSFQIALGRRVGVWRVLGYSGLGGLVNVLVPWDAGELIKVGLIRRHVPLRDAIAGTVIWNYLCKLSRPIVGTLAAIFGLCACPELPSSIRWAIVGASVLSAAPYIAIKWLLHWGASEGALRLLAKLRLLRPGRSSQWAKHAVEFDGQIREFYLRDPRAYWEMLFHQIFGRLASWAALHLTTQLLGLNYSLATTALLFAGISVATYVYMILPSRLGVGEVAGAGVFALLGLPFDAGLLVQLVMRLKGLVTLTLAATLAAHADSLTSHASHADALASTTPAPAEDGLVDS